MNGGDTYEKWLRQTLPALFQRYRIVIAPLFPMPSRKKKSHFFSTISKDRRQTSANLLCGIPPNSPQMHICSITGFSFPPPPFFRARAGMLIPGTEDVCSGVQPYNTPGSGGGPPYWHCTCKPDTEVQGELAGAFIPIASAHSVCRFTGHSCCSECFYRAGGGRI